MFKKKLKSHKKTYIILFSLLIILFITLVILTIDNKKIVEIKEFINNDTKVLYITSDDSLKYPIEILEKYSIEYMKINTNELNMFERKKIKNVVDSKDLNNVLVIYQNGSIKDTLIEYESNESVNKFLQENNIIPEILSDKVNHIMNEVNNVLVSDYLMVYIPFKKVDEVENQEKIFKKISNDYSIEYKRIDAYLLSDKQHEIINKTLGLSLVEDQILILIKNKKMIANIRGPHSKKTFIQTLHDANFIDDLESKINEIDYNEYKQILKSQEKNILVIGSNNSKDSNEVVELLNEMIYSYNIKVSYLDVDISDTALTNKIKEKLVSAGYIGSFSLPIVIITESSKILDYAIGNSKEEYFLDIFIENGVIKGDVINE